MPASSWFFSSQGAVKAPAGLIIGLKDGIALPDDWELFTDANGYFLKGTDSDVDVGTIMPSTDISLVTGSGGSHRGSDYGYKWIYNYGAYYKSCTSNCFSPSGDNNSVGNHNDHSVGLQYTPAANKLKLIKALSSTSLIFEGGVLFSEINNADQLAYSILEDENGFLMASSINDHDDPIIGKNTYTGTQSDSHDHQKSSSSTADGCPTTSNNDYVSSAGGSHNHTINTPTITENLKAIYLRAYEIIDKRKITGLIGMWDSSAPIPAGWEIVAEANDRFIKFSTTPDLTGVGDDTIDISGIVGSRGHSHNYGGGSRGSVCTAQGFHSNTSSHNHSYSNSAYSFQPNRFYVKFIKYIG